MTTITPLEKLISPLGGQVIELQQLDYAAGGMSLLPLMKLRLAHAETLIDIGRLAELKGHGPTPDGGYSIADEIREDRQLDIGELTKLLGDDAFLKSVETRRAGRVSWSAIARHMLGLRHGLPGARRWRQVWSDHRLKTLPVREVARRAHAARVSGTPALEPAARAG